MNINKILSLLVLLSAAFYQNIFSSQDKIKMYAIYTPTHQTFVENWFLPSIKDDYEVILEKHDQLSSTGAFAKEGWRETMLFKIDVVIRGIRENWNKIFIHSDVDIQFFKPTKEIIVALMHDKDMAIQLNNPKNGEMCAGFFACRGNQKNLDLWLEIRRRLTDKKYLEKNPKTHDQAELNRLVRNENVYHLKWDYLPIEFYCPRGGWNPGRALDIPNNLIMHHANWTIGIKNKLSQLEYVKSHVLKSTYGIHAHKTMTRTPEFAYCSVPEEITIESGIWY